MTNTSMSRFLVLRNRLLDLIIQSETGISESKIYNIVYEDKDSFSENENLTPEVLLSSILDYNEVMYVCKKGTDDCKFISREKYYHSQPLTLH